MLVDALLDFLPQQRADTLILEADKPPVLSRAGVRKALSMPGLDDPMLRDIVEEITSETQRELLVERGELELPYRTAKAVEFAVSLRHSEGRVRLVFRSREAQARAQTKTSAASASTPVVPAAPAPVAASVALAVDHAGVPVAGAAQQATLSDAPSSAQIDHPGLTNLLERATLQGASDLFISPGVGVHIRVGVDLVELQDAELEELDLRACFARIWPRLEPELARTGAVDFAAVAGLGPLASRFRVNLFRQRTGLAAAFRPIRREAPTLRALGLSEELHELTAFRNGLVLMTGQAGAGKSTTLVALLERLNATAPRHIITIEDPIEYVYPRGRALIHQRELGVHVDSFGAGLRAALRESPDIILVGEMRDRETISAALTAAETGHLVLSTLHCADASSAVHRIIDGFPEHQQAQIREQLASSLRAVVTQRLLPGLRVPRVAAYELMRVNVPVAAKIRERRGHQLRSEIQKGRSDGMVPLELTLARLVQQRRVSEDTARAHAHDPRLFGEYLRQG